MTKRDIFDEAHEQFRRAISRFIEREITPYHKQWEADGQVSREVWLKAGEAGLLCPNVSEDFGGIGADFMYNVVITEELARAGCPPRFYAPHDVAGCAD